MAPSYAVEVRIPFWLLVASRACSIGTAWRLTHGWKTSPFQQNLILARVRRFRHNCWAVRMEAKDVITLPFALWRNV